MARDKGRLDLRADIREALTPYVLEDRMTTAMTAVMMSVLPHFELAYKRGLVAGHSRAGYKIPNPRKEN
ncbi:hypothetical protein [Streptomyces sp. NPDC058664]|uniref:hypothetical protein n=1 Tax=unclassified Streptomyces TaxID=2593676 RepID=UPI003661FD4F